MTGGSSSLDLDLCRHLELGAAIAGVRQYDLGVHTIWQDCARLH